MLRKVLFTAKKEPDLSREETANFEVELICSTLRTNRVARTTLIAPCITFSFLRYAHSATKPVSFSSGNFDSSIHWPSGSVRVKVLVVYECLADPGNLWPIDKRLAAVYISSNCRCRSKDGENLTS